MYLTLFATAILFYLFSKENIDLNTFDNFNKLKTHQILLLLIVLIIIYIEYKKFYCFMNLPKNTENFSGIELPIFKVSLINSSNMRLYNAKVFSNSADVVDIDMTNLLLMNNSDTPFMTWMYTNVTPMPNKETKVTVNFTYPSGDKKSVTLENKTLYKIGITKYDVTFVKQNKIKNQNDKNYVSTNDINIIPNLQKAFKINYMPISEINPASISVPAKYKIQKEEINSFDVVKNKNDTQNQIYVNPKNMYTITYDPIIVRKVK